MYSERELSCFEKMQKANAKKERKKEIKKEREREVGREVRLKGGDKEEKQCRRFTVNSIGVIVSFLGLL